MMAGGCFCGFVRYQATGATSNETNCHCSICRRTSGAPFVAWVTVPRDGFHIVTGEPATFRSSEHGARTFCPRCGTPLTFHSDHFPAELDVTICSLEDPDDVPPKDHSWVRSKVSWVNVADALPQFQGRRPP